MKNKKLIFMVLAILFSCNPLFARFYMGVELSLIHI